MVSGDTITDNEGNFLLELRNFSLQPPFKSSSYHRHHFFEISLVKEGTGKYYADNKVYTVNAGDVFIFNNTELHRIEVDGGLINMVIHFEPRFIWSMQGSIFDYRFLKIFFERNSNFSNKLDRENPATKRIGDLLLEIEEEFLEKHSEYELMIKVKLMNVLALLLRHYDYVVCDKEKQIFSSSNTMGLSEVMNHIDSHLSDDLPLDELARIAHKNYSYFSSLFKKYNGISLSEYISIKRVRLAMEHLKSTNKTMLEIAGLCGFNSLANFNKTFRKIAGTTPTEFRSKKFY